MALAAISEVLGLFSAISPLSVALIWALVLVAAGFVGVFRRGEAPRVRFAPLSLDRWTIAWAASLLPLLLLTAVVAAVAPPNTWDSMTYHMSRVVHWQQQASLAPYATHIVRQLHL